MAPLESKYHTRCLAALFIIYSIAFEDLVAYVTGFAKTRHSVTRTDIHFIAWHKSHTLALSRHTDDKAKDNQVCFHRQHFSDPVNP